MIVNSLLKEEGERRMKEYLGSSEFQTIWADNGQKIINHAIKGDDDRKLRVDTLQYVSRDVPCYAL